MLNKTLFAFLLLVALAAFSSATEELSDVEPSKEPAKPQKPKEADTREQINEVCRSVFQQVVQVLKNNNTFDPVHVDSESLVNLMGRGDLITLNDGTLKGLSTYQIKPDCTYESKNRNNRKVVLLGINVAFLELAYDYKLQAKIGSITTPQLPIKGTVKYVNTHFDFAVDYETSKISTEGLKVLETYGIKGDHKGAFFPLRPALSIFDSIVTRYMGGILRAIVSRSLKPILSNVVNGEKIHFVDGN